MSKREFGVLGARAILTALVLVFALSVSYPWLPARVRAAIKLPPPFDFNDDFYNKNGICFDPATQSTCQIGSPGINHLGSDSRIVFAAAPHTPAPFGTLPSQWTAPTNWLQANTN